MIICTTDGISHYDVDINPVVKSGEPEETQALDVVCVEAATRRSKG